MNEEYIPCFLVRTTFDRSALLKISDRLLKAFSYLSKVRRIQKEVEADMCMSSWLQVPGQRVWRFTMGGLELGQLFPSANLALPCSFVGIEGETELALRIQDIKPAPLNGRSCYGVSPNETLLLRSSPKALTIEDGREEFSADGSNFPKTNISDVLDYLEDVTDLLSTHTN